MMRTVVLSAPWISEGDWLQTFSGTRTLWTICVVTLPAAPDLTTIGWPLELPQLLDRLADAAHHYRKLYQKQELVEQALDMWLKSKGF